MHDDPNAEPLPPELRSALDALPRERVPGRLLEERTVRALREAGLVRAPERRLRFRAGWMAGAVAAGLALFLGGATVGQWIGAREARALVEATRVENAHHAAMAVERTGAAYVQALSQLAALGDSAGTAAQGREVAVGMLGAAAEELLRIAPDDPVAAAVLAAFQRDTLPAARPDEKQRLVWF